MIPRKKGCIITTSSLASIVGAAAPYSYTASKHAVIGLTKNGAADLGKYGIRVNIISPAGIATPFAAKQMRRDGDTSSVSQKEKAMIEGFCNRIGNLQGSTLTVEDVAEAGLYLESDEAKYVSGHYLVVDGGLTDVNHSWGLYRP